MLAFLPLGAAPLAGTPEGNLVIVAAWPNPQIPKRPDLGWNSTSLNLTTLANVTKPFLQADWPNPRITPRGNALQTHTNAVALNLLGIDQFFTAPGLAPDYDWPNPRAPQRSISLNWASTGLNLSTLATAFYQHDWPNPRIAPRANALLTHTNPVAVNLLAQDQFFTAPGQPPHYDWPNPLISKRADFTRNSPSLNVTTLAVPFLQTDWPNPRAPLAAISLRTHTDPVKLNLLGQDNILPGKATWPQSLRTPQSIADLPYTSLNLTTLASAAPAAAPFFQTDWPNPRRRRLDTRSQTFAGTKGIATWTLTYGYIKVWDGAAFVKKPVKVWSGTAWVIKPVKFWNGTTWQTTI